MASTSKLQKQRKNIVDTFLINPNASFAAIARLAGTSRATARNVIKRFRETQSLERKAGSGRIPGFINKKLALKVKKALVSKPNMSTRDLAKIYNISHMYVQKVKKKYKLRSYKVIKVPNRSDEVDVRAKKRARNS